MQPESSVSDERSAAVVLAAGQASRMGAPKTLLDFRGEPMVRRAARMALEAGYDDVTVVVARCTDAVIVALAGLPITVVVNARAPEGIGTSISRGIRSLKPDVKWTVLTLSDQPLVTSAYLADLRARAIASARPIVASRYAGTVGVPALFARTLFPQLEQLSADQGCKTLIAALADRADFVDCPAAGFDIDTPDDYARLTRLD